MTQPSLSGRQWRLWGSALISLAIASGCTRAIARQPAREPPPAASSTARPSSLLWARTSAEHHAAYLQAFRLAEFQLRSTMKRHGRPWAVILDIDETVLDDSQYILERWQTKTPATKGRFIEWCNRRQTTALPGAADFLHEVHSLGGRIVLITNRSEEVCGATRDNLHRDGLEFDAVLCSSGGGDKNLRFVAVQKGLPPSTLPSLDVVMWLGDNIQDFPGLTQVGMREAGDDAYRDFGTQFIVLPNPMYGSWTGNPIRWGGCSAKSPLSAVDRQLGGPRICRPLSKPLAVVHRRDNLSNFPNTCCYRRVKPSASPPRHL